MTKAFGAEGRTTKGAEDGTISFGEHYAASDKFDAIFRLGMMQVERAAHYLDGPGKRESKSLTQSIGFAFATESMRLTTRLMSVASWLMIRRALKDGDISAEEARAKRQRIKLGRIGRLAHVEHFDDLPPMMRQIVQESHGLHDRVIQLDRAIAAADQAVGAESGGPAVNDVGAQMARIEAAFAGQLPRRQAG